MISIKNIDIKLKSVHAIEKNQTKNFIHVKLYSRGGLANGSRLTTYNIFA